MTDRQLDSLRYTLWAQLQLPDRPVFADNGRGGFVSQVYGPPAGFMAKFIAGYHITIQPHPGPAEAGQFDAGCTVSVSYQHGGWERGGSNGVSTNLFHSVARQEWVDEATARQLYAEAAQQETDR